MIVYNEDTENLIIPSGLGGSSLAYTLMPVIKLTQEEYNSLQNQGKIDNKIVYLIVNL